MRKFHEKYLGKVFYLAAIMLFSLVANLPAHADYRKALNAYQNRDGITMLSQVKKSVSKKNNDGLMLLLWAMSIDQSTSRKVNLYKAHSEKKESTLQSILIKPQQEEIFELLAESASNLNIDAQFYLSMQLKQSNLLKESQNPKLSKLAKPMNEYAKDGSIIAITNSSQVSIDKKAKVGNPWAQMLLGLRYLRTVDYRKYGCNQNPEKPICQPRNEAKGEYWLKESLKNYESNGHAYMSAYYNSMCDLLQGQDDPKQLRQAYLWCLMGVNIYDQSGSRLLLDKMQKSGKLKIVNKKLDRVLYYGSWKEKHEAFKELNAVKPRELPDWIIEARKSLKKNKLPVFTYYVNDYMNYELEVYANGQVKIGFGLVGYSPYVNKDLLLKTSPKTVKSFLTSLKKIGFYDWNPIMQHRTFCDNAHSGFCIQKRYQATVRNGVKVHRLYYYSYPGSMDRKNETTKRLAQLFTLVEKYFPTQQLRCELGASEEYQKACVTRDKFLADLATTDLKKSKK